MAKGEAKKTNKYIDQERDLANRQYGDISGQLMGRLPSAQVRSDTAYNDIYGGYGDLLGRARAGLGSGNTGQYNDLYNSFKKFGDTGGIDNTGIERIRGKGVFDEFARTGGLSEADKENLRARSTAVLPSFYANLKDELNRTRNLQGGYAPGYDAQSAKMIRDQAYAANQAAAEAEGGIVDRVTEGRKWGAGSLSSAEQGLQDLLSRNKLAGWQGALGAQNSMADQGYRDRALNLEAELGALGGMRGLRTDTPGEEFGLYDRLLGSAGGRAGAVGNNLNLRAQYNPNVSTFDRVSGLLGAAGNLAMPFFNRSQKPTNTGINPRLPRQQNIWGSIYG